MRRIATLMVSFSLVLAVSAAAQSPPRLAVSDCGGAELATWACDTNTGTAVTVVGSVVIPPDVTLTELTGQQSVVRFDFLQPVPPWWQIGTGLCRPTGVLQVDYSAAGASCLVKLSDGGMVIGTRRYEVGPGASVTGPPLLDRQARLEIESALAVSWTSPPVTGDEVALFTFTVSRANTTGTGACDGCTECVNMWLQRVVLTQPVGVGDYYLYSSGEQGSIVGGQGHIYDCIVPANRTTWGQIKSLYR